jgi:hypothetical protein
MPGLAEEVVDAPEPEVDEELGTLVVADLDAAVVVGLVDPPDEHEAITSTAPPTRATAIFRRVAETQDRPPGWSLSTI